MTEVTAGTVALDEPLAAQLADPTGPVFLSRNGRRGRVLAVAGLVVAAAAALWIVALVAGVLGVATPGLIHLPGVRTDAPSGSASQGPGDGARRVVTRRLSPSAPATSPTNAAGAHRTTPALARRDPRAHSHPPAGVRTSSRRAAATAPRPATTATTARPQSQGARKTS